MYCLRPTKYWDHPYRLKAGDSSKLNIVASLNVLFLIYMYTYIYIELLNYSGKLNHS